MDQAVACGRELGALRSTIALLRPRQWVKNLFVVAPLALTPSTLTGSSAMVAGLAFLAFCALSSAGYLVNDIFDRERDRLHPAKCQRPVASGRVPVAPAAALALVLGLAGLGIAQAVSTLLPMAAAYLLLSLAYSVVLKRQPILDVMVIAAGFVLRVEAGARAAAIEPTVWIIICTWLAALFLALAKRRDDVALELGHAHRPSLAGYNLPFLDAAIAVVLANLMVAYVIWTTDADVMARMGTHQLYLSIPFVVGGVLRYLQILYVEKSSGAPTELFLTDKVLGGFVCGWAGVMGWLLYG